MSIETRAFDFIADIQTQTDSEVVACKLRVEAEYLGFQHFVIGGLPVDGRLTSALILDAWPQAWTQRYWDEGYFLQDGIATWSFRTTQPFKWSDTPTAFLTTPAFERIRDEADGIGLRDGFVVPFASPQHWKASLSFARDRPMDQSDRQLASLQIMATFAAGILTRPVAIGQERSEPVLTLRERECLSWTAAGKSAGDIADILGISHETVRAHSKNIRRKLQATSITQAVVEALRIGEIRP